MQKTTFLFDMDGVLFNSMPNHALAWVKATEAFGLKMQPEDVYMNEGRTGDSTIDLLAEKQWGRCATKEEKEKIYKHKSDIFNTCPQASPIPGAAEVLKFVKEKGMKIVLVTGSGQQSLLERLNTHFPGIFQSDLMVTAYDVKIGKPNPEPYLMGLEKAGAKPEESIVIENAPLGVEAGHRAGIFTIAVNTGPLQNDILKNAGADIVHDNMKQLHKWLEENL